ncbi:unnamed protein product [Victoria cruziana]
MNDLMTKSFVGYVELKKQALKDLEADPDLEMGQLSHADEEHLSQFFEEVGAIKFEMEVVSHLFQSLQESNEAAKSEHETRALKHLQDTMDADILTVLKKARTIKQMLEALDESNAANRRFLRYREGGPVDRTRTSVTRGLRVKLRELMLDFQSLRERLVAEHREGVKRKYFGMTGEHPTEEVIDEIVSAGKFELLSARLDESQELKERHDAVKEIQKNLMELHQIFLDMSVLVEVQGEHIDDIHQNVVRAGAYIGTGADHLKASKESRKQNRRKWATACLSLLMVLIMLLIVLAITSLVKA